jgi:hypothetical protein
MAQVHANEGLSAHLLPSNKEECREQHSSAAWETRRLVHTTKSGKNGACAPAGKRRPMSLVTAAERKRPTMPKSPSMRAAGQCISPVLAGAGLVGLLEGSRGQPSTAITQMSLCRSPVDLSFSPPRFGCDPDLSFTLRAISISDGDSLSVSP